MCMQAGRLEASIAYYTAALTISPSLSEVSASLGAAYRDLGFVKEAIHHARNSLRLCRGKDLMCQAEALSILVHALQHRCEWRDRDAVFAALSEASKAQIEAGVVPSCQPFHTLVYPLPARVIMEISKSYARQSAANVACPLLRQLHYPLNGGRLTIGYKCSHPTSKASKVYGQWTPARCVLASLCMCLLWLAALCLPCARCSLPSSLPTPHSVQIHLLGLLQPPPGAPDPVDLRPARPLPVQNCLLCDLARRRVHIPQDD